MDSSTDYTDQVEVLPAEGWYRDPFGLHEDRWMSQGRPTKLVRDGATESYDPPPDRPLPAELVPVTADSGAADGSGLRRSGDSGRDTSSSESAWQAGLDAISGGAVVDEPGSNW